MSNSYKQDILNKIIRKENIPRKEAEKILKNNIQNIKHIIVLWDYFIWCKDNDVFTPFSMNEDNHKKVLEIIKEKPYYDKSRYLSLSAHDVTVMSNNDTYMKYIEERGIEKKHPLHSIFLISKKEMDYIQSII